MTMTALVLSVKQSQQLDNIKVKILMLNKNNWKPKALQNQQLNKVFLKPKTQR